MAHDDEIVIDVEDINHEAHSNMWSFSPNEEDAHHFTPEDLTDFVSQVLEARREKLQGAAPMLFYCWHDAQVRQLRFSLVSAAHGRLPFGCALDETAELQAIAQQIVHSDWQNDNWGQAPTDDAEDDAVPKSVYVLPIFVAQLR